MGCVTITHPFHPLSQQQFSVLKRRRVSGVETLIIRHPDRGSLAVAEEWTDWGHPSTCADTVFKNTMLEFESLLELAVLVNQLIEAEGVDE
ncbi:Y4bD/Y4pK family protein [Granulosicoccus sp.]|nr:Y4bD/Y4pK family protein [Granulosicoccus sp.]